MTYANVMATMAVFIALGGSSYAAVTLGRNSVKSRNIAPGQVRASDIGTNAVTAAKVRNGSLGGADFAAGQIPTGPRGPAGPPGAKGDPGPGGVRAYAHVTRTVGGGFALDTARSKNVVNVTLPSTGNNDRPCVILPAGIDAPTAVAIGTVDAQNTDTSETAEVQHRVGGEAAQGCGGNSLALFLKRNGAGGTGTIAFNVLVP
jgi:hypothetical protein